NGSRYLHFPTFIFPPLVPAHPDLRSNAAVSLRQVSGPSNSSCPPAPPGALAALDPLGGPAAPSPRIPDAIPEAHQAVGRDDDDGEEDEADHRVERTPDHRQPGRGDVVRDRVVDREEGEGADPRSLAPAQTAEHGDDQELDGRVEAHRRRRELTEP